MPPPRIPPHLLPRLRAAISRKHYPPQQQAVTPSKGNIPYPIKWALIALGLGVPAHLFVSYIARVGSTDGISMVPTIPYAFGFTSQPWVIHSSLYRRGRNIQVGDVITFSIPNKPTEHGCKRVIGMPGDYVNVMSAGRENEDLEKKDEEGDWANIKDKVFRVPEGHCWVQGDNLEWSRDSRIFGPLPLAMVDSKVLCVFTSWGNLRWFKSGLEDAKSGDKQWVVM